MEKNEKVKVVNVSPKTAELCKLLVNGELEKARKRGVYSKNFVNQLETAKNELNGIFIENCTIQEVLERLRGKI